MIPEASVLVVGHDDERVGPFAAVLDGVDDARDMLHALEQARVAGMLVGCADWLYEADRRQLARGKVGEEPILVLQVCIGVQQAVGLRIRRAIRVERGEVRVIPERLMMELEPAVEWIHTWLPGECVAPAARIPLPAHASLIEPIANSGPVCRVGLATGKEPMVVVDRQQKLVGCGAWAKRRLCWLRRVDRKVIAVWPRFRGHVAIYDR